MQSRRTNAPGAEYLSADAPVTGRMRAEKLAFPLKRSGTAHFAASVAPGCVCLPGATEAFCIAEGRKPHV